MAVALVALLPGSLHAQVRDSVITTSASRQVRVAPDRASLYLVIDGTAETAADAIARLDVKLTAVGDAARKFASRVVVERPLPMGVSFANQQSGFPQLPGQSAHVARAVMRVQVSQLDHLSPFIAAMLASGASSVTGLSFELTAADSVRRARSAEALQAATGDATALATAMGGRLGALLDVSMSSNANFFQSPQINLDPRYNISQGIAPDVQVQASVTVRYRIVR
ncbi:MAG: SIMPL domain-containing protein [Gemmatimonadota bacterium]